MNRLLKIVFPNSRRWNRVGISKALYTDEEDSSRNKGGSKGAGIGKIGFAGFHYIHRREAFAELSS